MDDLSSQSFPPLVHLVVATPCFGGNVSCLYTDSLLGLQSACMRQKVNISFRMIAGDSLITRARNVAVQHFLEVPTATHLLFIDADIGFSAQQVFDLLAADKDVCGAVYPLKRFDWDRIKRHAQAGIADFPSSALNYVFDFLDPADLKAEGTFFPVRYIGTGFLMIKRSVFTRMGQRYPETRYRATHLGLNSDAVNGEANAFFDCAIDVDSGTYLSEDYNFCKRWIDMGGEIWADSNSRLTHIGTHAFVGNLMRMLEAATALETKNDGVTD